MTAAGCPPLPGVNRVEAGYSCPLAMEQVQALVQSGLYERVIVAASWDGYFRADSPICAWTNGQCDAKLSSPEYARDNFQQAERLWRLWVQRGVQVFVALPEPTLRFNQPREMARRTFLGLNMASAESVDVKDYFDENGLVRSFLERAADHAGAVIIDPAAQLCTNIECRFVDDMGAPILRDSNHLRASWVIKAMHYPDAILIYPSLTMHQIK